MSIPISVGVTGHRNLRQEDLPRLRQLVRDELQKLQKLCPDSEFIMVNSLASGADSLCAEEALDLGFRLVCPLPVAEVVYKQNFSPEELTVFERLRSQATEVFVAPDTEDGTPNRHFHFRQAGLYVSDHCHVLLALWDGSEPKPGGCGTAEIVDYKRGDGRDDGFVIHIQTPRNAVPNTVPPSARLLEPETGGLEKLLKETNEFNRDCKGITKEKALVDMPEKPNVIRSLERCYARSAAISGALQRKYLHTLRNIALFCVLLVVSYTLYDEGELMWMLFCYAAVLILYYCAYRRVLRGKYHENYIRYRMFAESLRVQTYMTAMGIHENVACHYVWSQKQQTLWIRTAIGSLTAGKVNGSISADKLCATWLDSQLAYHKSAYQRNHRKDRLCSMITSAMLCCLVILFVAVLVLEYVFTAIMEAQMLGIILRGWLKILWSGISAVTLFVSSYYGRLSYSRKSDDNAAMERLFAEASQKCRSGKNDAKEVLRQLAREEIIENGNWASYCMENTPTFSL